MDQGGSGVSGTVCVTGATGFIGGHLVEQLLARGYTVRGTVRDLDAAAEGFLPELPGASERLELVWADLMKEGSFDLPIEGCETVFHVASPFTLHANDPNEQLIAPAVVGTRNVLNACARSSSVRRVVLTSSLAAMVGRADGRVITEEHWNTDSHAGRNPYSYAKTEAERTAWTFMDEEPRAFDLVVINPVGVFGPSHRTSVNTSVAYVRDLMSGKAPAIVDLDVSVVDVRDVADAHIRAMEQPDASGRYLCGHVVLSSAELVDALKAAGYHRHRFPRLRLDSPLGTRVARALAVFQPKGVRQYAHAFMGGRLRTDNTRIRTELGVEFRPVGETLGETAADLIEKGHLERR